MFGADLYTAAAGNAVLCADESLSFFLDFSFHLKLKPPAVDGIIITGRGSGVGDNITKRGKVRTYRYIIKIPIVPYV